MSGVRQTKPGRCPERIETRVVHAGLEPDPSYGSITPPIHQTSTFVQQSPGEFTEDYDYSRSANPTRAALERALGELEGGYATAYASGMAATHAVLTALLDAGDHLILPQDLYGGTYRLVDKVLARFGLAYDLVDQRDLDALRAAVRPETRMIWVETPTNPRCTKSTGRRGRGGGRGRRSSSTTRSRPRSTSGRSRPARRRSSTRPPSIWGGTPTSSAGL